MSLLLLVLLLSGWGCAGYLAWEDFSNRYISWPPLVVLGMLGVIFHRNLWPGVYGEHILLNLGFLLLLMCVLVFYFWIKGVKNIFEAQFGWGDLVMMICVSTWFSPGEYLSWYLLSTFSAILGAIVWIQKRKADRNYPIPFVSYMGICFILFHGCLLIFNEINGRY